MTSKKKGRWGKPMWLFLLALVLAAAGFLAWQDNAIETSNVLFFNKKLPGAFDGFRVAQVSDLHNTTFGPDNSWLLNRLKEEKPDIIVVTGDLLDSRRTNVDLAMRFVRKAGEIAPVYAVSGNHESRGLYELWKQGLEEAGAVNLDGQTLPIERDGETISLIGLADPAVTGEAAFQEGLDAAEKVEGFRLLLSHRPARLEMYAQANVELVLSGHAHGGQVRLPILGALFAPDEGIFPKYTSGFYESGETSMYVSRGLGNSRFPFRVLNRPELVIIELKAS